MALLVTLSDYKAARGLSGTGNDTALTYFLGVASAAVRRYCGRNDTDGFEDKARTEVYDGFGLNSIQLREMPVTSVASVSSVGDSGTLSALDATAYRVDDLAGIVYLAGAQALPRGGFGPWGSAAYSITMLPNYGNEPQSWSVTYTAGYATIPYDLQEVVMQMVDALFAGRGANAEMQSESTGAQSYTRFTREEIDARWGAMLADFVVVLS